MYCPSAVEVVTVRSMLRAWSSAVTEAFCTTAPLASFTVTCSSAVWTWDGAVATSHAIVKPTHVILHKMFIDVSFPPRVPQTTMMAQDRQLVEKTVSANLSGIAERFLLRRKVPPVVGIVGVLHQPKALVQEGN
jgi:hypothetical protein